MGQPHLVDVAGLDDGDSVHLTVAVPVELDMDLGKLAGAVDVDAHLVRTGAGFEVTGEAAAQLDLQCHRCLTPISDELTVVLDDLVTDDPEDGQPTVEGDRIDLLPIVRDAVGLAMPLRPICRVDCQGLCPVCGNDLNSDPCGGHDEAPQNPFSVLEHLLDPE